MESSLTLGELKKKVDSYGEKFQLLKSELARVIVGHDDLVQSTLLALVAGGHVLIEGAPGLGKTLLVRTLGEAMDLHFARVQFTPDLMPADIVGTNIIIEDEHGQKAFRFQPGPVFTNLLLADEINRATPKTQSALLEAMQEHQVTVAGRTHSVDGVFFVVATQNPIEMEGTYPLPEAQLDRFIYKLMIGYPSRSDLIEVMRRTTADQDLRASRVLTPDDLLEMRRLSREVIVAPHLEEMAADIVMKTHGQADSAPGSARRYVRFGASPRGAQAIILTAKALALLSGRYNVSASDIAAVARPSLRHRIILNFEGEADSVNTDSIIDDVLDAVTASRKA